MIYAGLRQGRGSFPLQTTFLREEGAGNRTYVRYTENGVACNFEFNEIKGESQVGEKVLHKWEEELSHIIRLKSAGSET